MNKAKSKFKSRSRRPTPEGLRHLAQGCEARATLGKPSRSSSNPGGVVATRARLCVHCGYDDSKFNPRGLEWIVCHQYTMTGICTGCAHFALLRLVHLINISDLPHVILSLPLE